MVNLQARGPRRVLRATGHSTLVVSGAMLAVGAAAIIVAGAFKHPRFDPALPMPDDLSVLEPVLADSIRSHLRAVQDDPQDADRLGALGIVYEAHGYPDLALQAYEAAVTADPSNVRWAYFAAVVAHNRGKLALAESRVRTVIEGEATYVPAYRLLGEILCDRGRHQDAALIASRAIRSEPRVASNWVVLGRARLALGHLDQAVKVLTRAVAIDPQCHQAYHLLGRAYKKLGQPDKAKMAFASAESGKDEFTYDPWRVAIVDAIVTQSGRRRIALKHLKAGRWEEAAEQLEALVEDYPNAVADWNNLAAAYGYLGYNAKAKRALQKALELDEEHADSQINMAAVLLSLGDPAAALRHAERATALAPHEPKGFVQKGRILAAMERWDDSFKAFNEALMADARCVDAYRGQCRVLAKLQRPEEAIEACAYAVKIVPQSWQDRFQLARLLEQAGRTAEADAALEAALALDPGNEQISRAIERRRRRSLDE